MTKYLFLILGIIVCSIGFSYGQTTAPKYSNEFLNIGVGARALGMSNVQTASVNDVTSAYWNPAGLLNMKSKYEVALMHSEYFAGIARNSCRCKNCCCNWSQSFSYRSGKYVCRKQHC